MSTLEPSAKKTMIAAETKRAPHTATLVIVIEVQPSNDRTIFECLGGCIVTARHADPTVAALPGNDPPPHLTPLLGGKPCLAE